MSLLAKMRSGQARWGRPCLALLTFAWLNVILQPCAMAMTGDSAGCHHSSSVRLHDAESHGAMGGHDHAMVGHGQHDAPVHDHAPEHQANWDCTDCSGDLADCANLDEINKSDREERFTPDLKPMWLAPPPVECPQADNHGPPPSSGSRDAARLAGAYPPLNVLYCVYLD